MESYLSKSARGHLGREWYKVDSKTKPIKGKKRANR